LLNIIAAILIFGCIILIHEFGHFLLAKLNGVGVLEFSIGMGPKLCSITKGETCYSIRCLPFGGFCAMVGEDNDDYGDKSFQSKPVWARISVLAAGPIFNYILAFLAAIVIVLMIGHDSAVMTDVMEGYPAAEAGLQAGDKITKIDHMHIDAYRDISMYLYTHPGKTVTVTYQRPMGGVWKKGTTYEIRKTELTPKYDDEYQSYMLGVILPGYEKVKNPAELIWYSIYEVRYCISSTIESVGMLFRRQISADEAVAGPVQVVGMMSDTVGESREIGVGAIIFVIANWFLLLSASLGFMNLLPFPGLDGGRLVFLVIELIRGKPIDREKEGMVHAAGMMLLMAMMFFVMFQDITKMIR
jgi:regulator of sigma E protease